MGNHTISVSSWKYCDNMKGIFLSFLFGGSEILGLWQRHRLNGLCGQVKTLCGTIISNEKSLIQGSSRRGYRLPSVGSRFDLR